MLTVTEAGSGYSNVILVDVLISSCSITSSVDVPKSILDNSTVQGDLTVNLVSPTGTNVLLHDRSGSSADDIVTWYDDETTPAQPLSAFFGEDAQGIWTLIIEDHAGCDPDGNADVGETVWLSLAVRNAGTAPATAVCWRSRTTTA